MRLAAYRLFADGDTIAGRVTEMSIDDLSPGDVVIPNAFSSVNYKDALAGLGRNKIIRDYPRIGGIDLFGVVTESRDPRFKSGDRVIAHGFGIGVDHDGGHAEYARVKGDWVMRLPDGLTLKDAAVIGVAGYTAALSIHLMELNGLNPSRGPVVVNGATGGVASVAIDMLSTRGYSVTAITGKQDEHDYLRQLGAHDILDRLSIESSGKPLEKPRWAGAVDSLGRSPGVVDANHAAGRHHRRIWQRARGRASYHGPSLHLAGRSPDRRLCQQSDGIARTNLAAHCRGSQTTTPCDDLTRDRTSAIA